MEKIKRFREVVKCSNPPEDKTVFWLPENSNEDPVLRFYSNGEWVKVLPSVEGNRVNWGNIEGEITNQRDLSTILNDCNEENPAADKNFVNSSIATSTATFRGTFDKVSGEILSAIIIEDVLYGEAEVNAITYSFDINGYDTHLESTKVNVKKVGDNIVVTLTNSMDTEQTLSFNLTDVKQSITFKGKTRKAYYQSLYISVGEVTCLIFETPENSSDSIIEYGDWNNTEYAELPGNADNNDYLFETSIEATGNAIYKRYKWVPFPEMEGNWKYEYTLNNSSFTSNQWAAINSGINTTKVGLIDNIPIEKGTGTNSIIQKDLNNQTISENTIALGTGNVVGCKGYYWSSINIQNKTITLSSTQSTATAVSCEYAVGDIISIVDYEHYDICSEITAVNGSVITVNNLPFTSLDPTPESIPTDWHSVFCVSKPNVGVVNFANHAIALGHNSKATGAHSMVEGWNNIAGGSYSHTEGRNNKSGYASHTEGIRNENLGKGTHIEGYENSADPKTKYSHAEGANNTLNNTNAAHVEGFRNSVSRDYAHAEGYITTASHEASHAEGCKTTASGVYSHAEGHETTASNIGTHSEGGITTASGDYSHAEGQCTVASGWCSHSEGYQTQASGQKSHAEGAGTETKNACEHAEGYYNKSNSGSTLATQTLHSVGVGFASTRRNAFEIMKNGDVYVKGVGTYNGANPSSGTNDLKTVIDGKVNEPATDGTNGQVLTTDGNGGRTWTTVQGGGGGGSVSAVGLSMPTGFTVTGSPITTSGTFNVSLASGYTIPTTSTINGKENSSNKVTTITSSSTNTQYPSAKCVYDQIQVLDTKIGEILTAINSI